MGLISSCILKVINFIILRDFLEFFKFVEEFNSIYLELKWIKNIFISRADVATDVE